MLEFAIYQSNTYRWKCGVDMRAHSGPNAQQCLPLLPRQPPHQRLANNSLTIHTAPDIGTSYNLTLDNATHHFPNDFLTSNFLSSYYTSDHPPSNHNPAYCLPKYKPSLNNWSNNQPEHHPSPPSPPPPPPPASPPPPHSPPPIVYVTANSGNTEQSVVIYDQGSENSTCLRTMFDTVMKNMNVRTTSGPTFLSWMVRSEEVCTSSVCSLDLCGFTVGTYVLSGEVYFQESTGIPASTVSGA
ncbi:hypothetical protein CYMTET_40250 [Cymbomonas tetramitiformis]|uniref:Uncharacterized protein n=1 Tax=Cymbomonas tetramitiformis TaxID=36881 RepID=A0AAE0C9U5_9CHLO|nr:hypothetical protein CYMTET_40250 [Cymbomonas tetramitiformis]